MKKKKLYIARKYLMATSLAEAIKIEKKTALDEIWLDEDYRKSHDEFQKSVGFKIKK